MTDARPLTIVHDARYLDAAFSGIGDYSANLLVQLSRIDWRHRHHVFVREGFDRALPLGENFTLHRIGAAPLSPATIFRIGGEVARRRPDLFHAHFPVVPLRPPVPMVVTVHDLQPLQIREWTGGRPWPLPWLYRRFYGWHYPHAFRSARRLLTPSEATRDALVRLDASLTAKTIAVLSGFTPRPEPPDAEAIWNNLRGRHGLDGPFLLYYGSTRPNKNIPGMLRAFARFRARQVAAAGFRFVLVLQPDRFFWQIRDAIAELGLGDAVRILGQVSEEEKQVLLLRAWALFFVTALEGFGIPIVEAQAVGLPVVTSTDSAAPEVAGDGALLVDWRDLDAAAGALGRLLTEPGLRERLAELGRRNIGRFNWLSTARRVLAVYEEIGCGAG